MRDEFLLDPDVVFLNHGSFGACPRVVHEEYQRLQRRLESQPVRFLQRELPELLNAARKSLANYIDAEGDEVVFVPNPSFAVNEVARSLKLESGDEVLMSDQEYGACRNAWLFMSQKSGFSIVEQPISLPAASDAQLADEFWKGVTEETAVIFLSQITSQTALTFPVAEICRRAREANIITLIDGAHAPGQIDVDMKQIGADFYVATCHKWMCAPKGTSFLYARQDRQAMLEPLVVGWGWGENRKQFNSGSDFLDHHQWLGTHDPSGYLSVPAAIAFQQENNWSRIQHDCHELAITAIDSATERMPGVARVHKNEQFYQLALIELQQPVDAKRLKQRLYDQHRIEVPITEHNHRQFVRVSVQAYNSDDDIARFVEALAIETAS